jgi:hypothetical protein
MRRRSHTQRKTRRPEQASAARPRPKQRQNKADLQHGRVTPLPPRNCESAVAKHALSGDFASQLQPSGCANTEKKGICASTETKKYLRKLAGVLFFAAISTARATPRLLTLFEE